jgi:internalin A
MITTQKVQITLAIGLGWLLGCTSVGRSQTTREYKTFAQWCEHLSELSAAEKYTVEALLREAGTRECQTADRNLARLTSLELSYDQITDIKPLSKLNNLKGLNLNSNQIADIKPISNLTDLTILNLNDNRIVDIKPLSNLTKLTILSLDNNPIADRTCPPLLVSLCRAIDSGF